MHPEPKSMTRVISDVHTHLLAVQRSYRDRIIQELPICVSSELPEIYILESEALPFSPRIFREICLRIAPLLAEQNPEADFVPFLSELQDEILLQLAHAVQHSPEQDWPLALKMAIKEVRLQGCDTLAPEALCMLLLAAFVPFYAAFAQQSSLNLDAWQKGWCPICGQYPVNGYNRPGDGRRILGCWLCDTQWSYSRTLCPVCGGGQGREGLLLLTPLGGDGRRRIQVCEDCGHYLKITDCTEASEECDLQVENSATVNLDILAQRKGYRPASYPQRLKQ